MIVARLDIISESGSPNSHPQLLSHSRETHVWPHEPPHTYHTVLERADAMETLASPALVGPELCVHYPQNGVQANNSKRGQCFITSLLHHITSLYEPQGRSYGLEGARSDQMDPRLCPSPRPELPSHLQDTADGSASSRHSCPDLQSRRGH